ncbi:hypothetical protein BDV95DRAFT_144102 [Massariosphaeria phaeospora]|uniref:Uncharacterized protein n=1 Tax=Massariosphaeria phaeospora TaxID=100035 RepID=A0A7C8IIE1_9PLEO|nr:hypothetical protein BDV95DRAFT_144102 [Massariosphaeria phaeospora]
MYSLRHPVHLLVLFPYYSLLFSSSLLLHFFFSHLFRTGCTTGNVHCHRHMVDGTTCCIIPLHSLPVYHLLAVDHVFHLYSPLSVHCFLSLITKLPDTGYMYLFLLSVYFPSRIWLLVS